MLAVKNITDPMYSKIPLYKLLETTKEDQRQGYSRIETNHEGKRVRLLGKI